MCQLLYLLTLFLLLLCLGMMFLMPKMMEGLDPEEKERMKQQMEMQKDPSKMLSQLWGDISGGEADAGKAKKKRN